MGAPHPGLFEDLFCQIIKYFGLGGNFKGHLYHPPCNEQGYLQLDQVTQSPSDLALEVSRETFESYKHGK